MLVACGSPSGGESESTSGASSVETSPEPSPEPTPESETVACDAHADCAPCLAAECNWTAGRCSDECLMDVSCFGPGNSAAPDCPAVQPEESAF